jgi:PAS domain S-box-containing protein
LIGATLLTSIPLLAIPVLLKSSSKVAGMMPHGFCLRWQPGLLFLHVGSDTAIGLAYVAISAILIALVRKNRADIPFSGFFVAFGAFIIACGLTHLVEVWTLWHADYWTSGGFKLTTAVFSVMTAVLLPRTLPRVSGMIAASRLLRESEARLCEAQRMAHMASFTFDCAARTLTTSDEHFHGIFGLAQSVRTISYEHLLELLDSGARAQVQEANQRLIEDGAAEWKMSLTAPNGFSRRVRCAASSERDAVTGRVVRTIGIVQDITEQEQAEERLHTSEERFRLIALAASDTLWDWDLRGTWCWFSEGLTTHFGHDLDQNGGASFDVWTAHIHPYDYQRICSGILQAIDGGAAAWHDEYRFRRADRTYALVRNAAVIVREESGRAIRLVGSMTDITRERKLADDLARSQRVDSLGRLAVSIAHEFNNVLMGIQPHLDLLRRRSDPQTVSIAMEHISNSVRRGKRVTDDIQQFTHSATPVLEHITIAAMLETWRREIAPVLAGSVALHIDVGAAGGAQIHADPLKLAQVLTNLATNARDAMPAGGNLRVEAGLAGEQADAVQIVVADEGVGMTSEQLARAFEPLYTTKKGGTGLGLPISFQIIAAHGGTLTVESEAGHGAAFTITLPVTNRIAPQVHPDMPLLDLRRVLLVEDEPAVAMGLQYLLEIEGVDVKVVHTGAEALAGLEAAHPEAVILDIGLPDMDGREVFIQMRKRWPDLPVLFSSGHAGADALSGFLAAKHTGLLVKPYDLSALKAALTDVVAR